MQDLKELRTAVMVGAVFMGVTQNFRNEGKGEVCTGLCL